MVGTGPPSSSSSSMFTAWIAAMSRIDFTNSAATAAAAVNSTSSSDSMPEVRVSEGRDSSKDSDNQAVGYSSAQLNLGFKERAFSVTGAAFLSAIIVNPLDVVKTRMQAQAAGAPYYPHAHENLRTSMATLGENTELELDKFVTDKVSFADINKAFDHMLKGEGLRTVIKVIQD